MSIRKFFSEEIEELDANIEDMLKKIEMYKQKKEIFTKCMNLSNQEIIDIFFEKAPLMSIFLGRIEYHKIDSEMEESIRGNYFTPLLFNLGLPKRVKNLCSNDFFIESFFLIRPSFEFLEKLNLMDGQREKICNIIESIDNEIKLLEDLFNIKIKPNYSYLVYDYELSRFVPNEFSENDLYISYYDLETDIYTLYSDFILRIAFDIFKYLDGENRERLNQIERRVGFEMKLNNGKL